MRNSYPISIVKSYFGLVFILIFTSIVSNSFSATFTSIASGSWNSGDTWDQSGAIPESGDDIIIDIGDIVTITSESTVAAITILGLDSENYGKLIVSTGGILSTTGHTIVYGKLEINDGVFNEGNSSGDKLNINGQDIGVDCSLMINGGILNISRYFSMNNQSTFEMTGGTINVNSSGGSSSTDIFYVPAGSTFNMSGGDINILNGNLGSGDAVKFNPTYSLIAGGSINFLNTKDYSQTNFVMNGNVYDIVCDVGDGNELVIQNMSYSEDGYTCNDVTINSGKAIVSVNSGVTVSGQLNNNTFLPDGLTVLSDNSGNGSLILEGSVNGEVCINRYIPSYTNSEDGWHLISSPVNNMPIPDSDFEPGSNDDLYRWNESLNTWLNYKDPTNGITNLTNGSGNMVAYENELTGSFTGIPNTSDLSFTNLSLDQNGWHLLGNPFPSAIEWGNVDWNLTNVGGVAKVWSDAAGNYMDIAENEIIPSTNGFFIQVAFSTNSITIPTSARVHDSEVNNFKCNDDFYHELKITVSDDQNEYFDKTKVGFKSDATAHWDLKYDSRKLFGIEDSPQLYTVSNDEMLSTNYLSNLDESINIPLCFIPGTNGSYCLSFDSINSLVCVKSLYLIDKKENIEQDLKVDNQYFFNAEKGDDPQRFNLKFNCAMDVGNTEDEEIIPVVKNGRIYFQNNAFSKMEMMLYVHTIEGKCLYSGIIDDRGFVLKDGIYLITFQDKNTMRSGSSVIIVKN